MSGINRFKGLTSIQSEAISGLPNAFFTGSSSDTVDISTIAATPTTLADSGFTLLASEGFEWDDTLGAIKNVSGRTIECAFGGFSAQLNHLSGVGTLYIASEISSDGVTWTSNPLALRQIKVKNGTESLEAIESEVVGFPNGYYGRFFFWAIGTVGFLAINAEGLAGKSFLWNLREC